jgi:hypothetical protein
LSKFAIHTRLQQGCAAHGVRGVRTPPRLENFQFLPAKIAYFIEKKIIKLKKNV